MSLQVWGRRLQRAACPVEIRRTIGRLYDWGRLVAVVLAVGCTTPPATLSQERFSTRSFRGRGPLSVSADALPLSDPSYRQFHVTVTDGRGVSPADRNLTVVLFIGSSQYTEHKVAYHRSLVLPQGAQRAECRMTILAPGQDFCWDVGIFEDGVDIEDKRRRSGGRGAGATFQWTGSSRAAALPAACLVGPSDDSQELERDVLTVYGTAVFDALEPANALGPQMPKTLNVEETDGNRRRLPTSAMVDVAAVEPDWRTFAPRLSLFVSQETLRDIVRSNPPVVRSLRWYVAGGGCLVVVGNSIREEWPVIDEFLNLDGKQAGSGAPPWRSGTATAVGDGGSGSGTSVEHAAPEAEGTLEEKRQSDGMTRWVQEVGGEEWIIVPYGRGRVFAGRHLTQLSPAALAAAKDQALGLSRIADARLSEVEDGDWFLRHLISGVGKTPVWGFCLIVTLFSLILGPGLLFLTRRLGRRSLLVFLVPVVSLVATTAILFYNVVHEGFGAYARVTSVTRYHHRTGDAFSWSRQTYFSGWPPAEGLRVEGQALLRPVSDGLSGVTGSYYGDPRKGVTAHVYLDEEGQVCRSWLRPRQQMQMLIIRPTDGFRPPLRVRPLEGNRMRVANLTAQTLPLVVVCGDEGAWFWHQELEPGEVVELRPRKAVEIEQEVRSVASRWLPERPAELDEYGSLWSFTFGSRFRSRSVGLPRDPIGKVLSGCFQSLDGLKPGQYVTIVRENPAIPIPLEGAEVTEALHVVIGEMPW